MTVVTLSRKLGSQGNGIARLVAEQLDCRVVSRKVINEAAARSGAPEEALAEIDDLKLLGVRSSYRARRAYHAAVRQVLEELAQEGNIVIVGRAGQVILRGRPGVLHVRVTAPQELRIERVVAAQGISLEAARARVTCCDKNRRTYLRRNYHADWDDPALYDLVINTAHIPAEIAAALIVAAVREISAAQDTAMPKGHTA